MSESLGPMVPAAAGVAAVLLFAAIRSLLSGVPQDRRSQRDKPPALWRFAWPLVGVIAPPIDRWLPPGLRERCRNGLRRAGLDGALDPAGYVAGRLLLAVASFAVMASLIAASGLAIRPVAAGAAAGIVGWLLPAIWLREAGSKRFREIGRALPFYLDLLTLSVESGSNLTGALAVSVERGPGGPLREELARVLRDLRTGRTRAEALRSFAARVDAPAVGSWVAAMLAADRNGGALGPILRAQAEQRRQERFQAAEKLAMQAPVKMLFPLLVFIFPCTFTLLLFPIVVRLLQEGLLR